MKEELALARYLSQMVLRYPQLHVASIFPGAEHDQPFQVEYDYVASKSTYVNYLVLSRIKSVPKRVN
jgi:hypothetical protein